MMREFQGETDPVRAFRRLIRKEDNRQYLRRTRGLDVEQGLPSNIARLLKKLEECEQRPVE